MGGAWFSRHSPADAETPVQASPDRDQTLREALMSQAVGMVPPNLLQAARDDQHSLAKHTVYSGAHLIEDTAMQENLRAGIRSQAAALLPPHMSDQARMDASNIAADAALAALNDAKIIGPTSIPSPTRRVPDVVQEVVDNLMPSQVTALIELELALSEPGKAKVIRATNILTHVAAELAANEGICTIEGLRQRIQSQQM